MNMVRIKIIYFFYNQLKYECLTFLKHPSSLKSVTRWLRTVKSNTPTNTRKCRSLGCRIPRTPLKPWFRHMRICLYSDHSILAENRLAHTRETEFNKPDGTRHVSKHSPKHPECLQTPYPTSIWGQPVYLSNQDLGPLGGFFPKKKPNSACVCTRALSKCLRFTFAPKKAKFYDFQSSTNLKMNVEYVLRFMVFYDFRNWVI